MRLGKTAKFNMIIAILLCMAFVVNLGSTFALVNYTFKASSVNNISVSKTEQNTYVNHEYAQGSSGTYVYSVGTYTNQLSINYGFRANHDLIIRFTATYKNTNHSASDFSLNFANRDVWIVDAGATNGLKIEDGKTVMDASQTYYSLTSSANTISGVMYYTGTLNNSGTLPVISGVTFYTSPNGYQSYVGDILTVTITPEYVKSGTYTTDHQFYTDTEACNNWINYKSEAIATASEAEVMIYNAYVYDKVDETRSTPLNYPQDSTVIKTDGSGVVNPSANVPTYSNTAYRYTVNQDGSRDYDALTAGNKYYGGLGVYVIPNSKATAGKIVTVGIVFKYYWQKDGNIIDTAPSGIVTPVVSSDITTITSGTTNYYYYRETISGPTYINVLDHIRLTAEYYSIIIKNGYSLILNEVSVSLKTSAPTGWESSSREDYTIINSSQQSAILVRVEDVLQSSKTYEAKLSITNNSNSIMQISSFTLRGYLWYGSYTTTQQTVDDGNGGTTEVYVEKFTETPLGNKTDDECYLRGDYKLDSVATIFTPQQIWKYDTSLWSCAEDEQNPGTYEFTYLNGVAYIPKGYTIDLIKGVTIPETKACQGDDYANDFWCSIEDVNINASTDSTPDYQNITSTTGLETIVEGYYSAMDSSNPGKIYIRNNTNQVITNVTLNNDQSNSTLVVYALSSGTKMARDRLGSIVTDSEITSHLTGEISIKPNELVLAYTIKPKQSSVIYDFKLTATLKNSAENSDIDLVYNAKTSKGEVINNSTYFYEFRMVSTKQLTNLIAGKFIEKIVDGKFYYYYKGIISPHQCITIFDGAFTDNTINITIGSPDSVDKIVHESHWGADHYKAENYTVWKLNDTTDVEWFDAMKKPYTELSTDDRAGALVVPKA